MSRPPNPLRKALFDHIMAGGRTKYFALTHGMHPTNPGKLLNAMGVSLQYVTEEEYAGIVAARKRAKLVAA